MRPGSIIEGRFEILREVAAGGMGRIFLARDHRADTQVAIKIGRRVDARLAERFVRECTVLAQMSHPAIVRYIAHGMTAQDEPYLAMEWLDGEDLSSYLFRWRALEPGVLTATVAPGDPAQGNIAVTKTADPQSYQKISKEDLQERGNRKKVSRGLRTSAAVAIGRRVGAALAELHRRGIVHRDIKPSNLFLPERRLDRVKLLDFGTARWSLADHSLTATGAVVGTPAYMAPEQVQASGVISPATDIWALGCVLYEALTLKQPFVANQLVALFAKILMEEVQPLHELRPDVPSGVVALIHRMLSKNATVRPRDADALLSELEQVELKDFEPHTADESTASIRTVDSPRSLGEQQLVCMLVIEMAGVTSNPRPLVAVGNAIADSVDAQRQRLEEIITLFDARREWLMDGTLVLTLGGLIDAVDLAAHAARCALALGRELPSARIALTTGRGSVGAGLPLGETIDRAVAILRRTKEFTGGGEERDSTSGRIWVDTLSARLLERRFTVNLRNGEMALGGKLFTDAARPLLGRATPCVGRDAELGGLELRWQTCVQESEGQAVLVTAPAGMGKSRLGNELLRRIRSQSDQALVLEGRAELLNARSPYYAIGQMLRRHCEVEDGDASAGAVSNLSSRLGRYLRTPERVRTMAFLAELTQIPLPEPADPALRAARKDPKAMREHLRKSFVAWLRAETAAAPVMMILEDLQWSDPLTIDLLDYTLEQLGDSPLFLLALSRPEIHGLFPKLWQRHRVQEVLLKGLSRKASERLIHEVLGKASERSISPELAQRLWEQSGGNALFLEELIRAVAEGQTIDQADTVRAMLQARFGRFSAIARQVLRAASPFGRSFSASGVAAVLDGGFATMDVELGLHELTASESIEQCPDTLCGEPAYAFRHALVREAAYALLTPEDRELGHERAGRYLIAAGSTEFLQIAEHLERGAMPKEALRYYLQAAERSLTNADFAGTLSITERAVACEASGEQLGRIRALQGRAYESTLNELERSQAYLEALQLLTPGCIPWCQCIYSVISRGLIKGERETANRWAHALVAASPDDDAVAAYMEALGASLYNAATAFRMDLAELFHARGDEILDTHPDYPVSPIWGFAKSQYVRMVKPDPWLQLQAIQNMHSYYMDVGQPSLEAIAEDFLGEAQGELGDLAGGEATLRASLARAEQGRQSYLVVHAQLHLAALLSATADGSRCEEVVNLARTVLTTDGVSNGYRGWAHLLLAQAMVILNDPRQAELEAQRAWELSATAPLRRLQAMTTRIDALLAQDCRTEARAYASQTLDALAALGRGGYAEVPLRLAVARALSAVHEEAAAKAQLQAAAQEIRRRAARIPKDAARAQYLACIREHVHVFALLNEVP